jgi:predicted nucleotidyltransferase
MFEQDRVIVRLQQRVMADSDIEICFLAGSYGRRTEDAYSDLDVALVFPNELRRDFAWNKRRAFVKSVTPYVPCKSFDAEHVRPFFHIALYSNGAKVDYRYEVKEQMSPNPWDRDIRILKESEGWAAQYQAQCAQTYLQRPHMTAAELQAIDERFWVMFWDVYRQVARGDYDKPFTAYLELLHFTLPPLLHVLPPEDPAHQALLKASYSADTKGTAVHLRQLLAAYLGGRTAVVRRLNLPFNPDTSFETQIQRVLERTK